MRVAWRSITRSPRLLSTVLSKTPAMVANAGAWVSLNLVAGPRLAPLTTAIALGVLQCARAIGTGLGPLAPERLLPRNPLIGPAVAFAGIALFLSADSIWLSLLAVCIWGAGGGHNWVVATAEIQASTKDNLLGRVTSIDFLIFSIGGAISALVAGALCDAWESPTAGAWATTAAGLLIWLYCLSLSRRSPSADESQPDEQQGEGT